MDKFYENELYQSSHKVSLQDYFKEYKDLLSETCALCENDESDSEMEKICDVSNLNCKGENTKIFPVDSPELFNDLSKSKDFITETCNLNVSKCKLEFNKQKLLFFTRQRRDFSFNNVSTSKQIDLKENDDYIVSILVFRPFFYKFFSSGCSREQLKLSQEIRMLGRNFLSELKDRIHCISDEEICCEVENTENFDLSDLPLAKEICPSSFFFIDNIFYNDFRSPESIDYSQELVKWAAERSMYLKKGANMDCVRLRDLSFKLGYPYLYKHQGECEHILVFSDAKLLQKSDFLCSELYPFIYKEFKPTLIQCNCCEVEYAKWIIKDSDRFPRDIVYLCTKCCNSYNFVDGKKVGNFKLYPLLQKQ